MYYDENRSYFFCKKIFSHTLKMSAKFQEKFQIIIIIKKKSQLVLQNSKSSNLIQLHSNSLVRY